MDEKNEAEREADRKQELERIEADLKEYLERSRREREAADQKHKEKMEQADRRIDEIKHGPPISYPIVSCTISESPRPIQSH